MKNIEKIKSFLSIDNQEVEIGEMVHSQNKIYFKFSDSFIENGINISPIKMKLSNEILSAKEDFFDGLFGVFADSLPDGWGKLLLDRKLLSIGYDLNQINALDRLSYLNNNSIGAITYKPQFQNDNSQKDYLDLDIVSNEIEIFINEENDDVLEKLFLLGGSSGGARPKINVGYNPITNQICSSQEILPNGFEHWIIKFPSSFDMIDVSLIEYTYNQMAVNAGIETNLSKLFKSKSGKYFFGSKRFDRIDNKKLHMHSVAGLLHDNFRMSTIDYGHIMDCAFVLENNINAYSKILKLAAFNVFAHNRDDHSKNFSFLMDSKGNWKFSPAYDLTYSNSAFGMHSTTVAGESKSPTEKHLLELANHFGVKNASMIIEQVKDSISSFKNLAINNGVSKNSIDLISKNILK